MPGVAGPASPLLLSPLIPLHLCTGMQESLPPSGGVVFKRICWFPLFYSIRDILKLATSWITQRKKKKRFSVLFREEKKRVLLGIV